MPSARDLLQQADALMRSHRNVGAPNGQETVPVLTDVAIPGGAVVVTRQRVEEIPVLTNVVADVQEPLFDLTVPMEPAPAPHRFPPTQTDPLLLPLSEMPPMPELDGEDSIKAGRRNDARFDGSPESVAPIDDEMPKWLEADLLDSDPASEPRSATETAPRGAAALDWESMPARPVDALSAQPMAKEPLDAPDDEVNEKVDERASSDEAPPAAQRIVETAPAEASDEPHADSRSTTLRATPNTEELAETVYFQVLQNLDLYTERALQQHMTAHLSPIIERATQELLATLNANLGALVRQFVADAIEKQLGVRPASDKPTPEV